MCSDAIVVICWLTGQCDGRYLLLTWITKGIDLDKRIMK